MVLEAVGHGAGMGAVIDLEAVGDAIIVENVRAVIYKKARNHQGVHSKCRYGLSTPLPGPYNPEGIGAEKGNSG